MSGSAPDLTLCTVVRADDKNCLRAALELAATLNENALARWLIVDNWSEGTDRPFSLPCASCEWVKGVSEADITSRVAFASYHHAAAIRKILPLVETRFLGVIDPDFLIVWHKWMTVVPAHMERRGLAFFGAPWHPFWYSKYRYFPAPHCMFIDRHKVPQHMIDLTPRIEPADQNRVPAIARDRGMSRRTSRLLWTLIDEMVVQRRQIGSSQDTGSRMYATLAGRPDYPVETVTPVAHRVDFRRPSLLRYAVFRWLERLLPDRLAYIPRRRRAFTERGFAAAGLPDLYAVGWEEYMWNLRPFGFHLRMHGAAQSGRPPHACEGVADVSAIAREIAVKLIGDV